MRRAPFLPALLKRRWCSPWTALANGPPRRRRSGAATASISSRRLPSPHSLGLLYSAFTYYTGFRVNSGEYKLMGLAPYGEPKYAGVIRDNLLDVKPDGSLPAESALLQTTARGLTMTNGHFDRLFGGPARKPEEPLAQRHMDLAGVDPSSAGGRAPAHDPCFSGRSRTTQPMPGRAGWP